MQRAKETQFLRSFHFCYIACRGICLFDKQEDIAAMGQDTHPTSHRRLAASAFTVTCASLALLSRVVTTRETAMLEPEQQNQHALACVSPCMIVLHGLALSMYSLRYFTKTASAAVLLPLLLYRPVQLL